MTTDPQITDADRKALYQAAWQRRQYVRWIAEKLLVTDDKLIRQEASKLLFELTETK